jgi:hypothetical protein
MIQFYLKKLPRNDWNAKDDPYETLKLACNREMDQLVETNTSSNDMEEEDFVACSNGIMKELGGEMEESHDEEENLCF